MEKITKMKGIISTYLFVLASCILVMSGCNKGGLEDETFLTAEGELMAEYFYARPDTFSEFYRILEITNSVSFMNSYNIYTCFAPTNEAVNAFAQEYKQSTTATIDDFTSSADTSKLKQIVRFHLCPDSITTSDFREGGLPDTTLSGDFLTSSFGEGGINNIIINDKAKVVQRDIHVTNGIIHAIDKVLDPVELMVGQMIEKDSRFSIFAKALTETGIYDSLNIRNNKVTVFAESDSVLNLQGINTYDDLFKKFSQTGQPNLNPSDSLYLWVAYHCMDNNYFLKDFENQTYDNFTRSTLLTIFRGNEFTLNQVTLALPENSNNTAKNGVYHAISNLLTIIPTPVPVYWEILDYPELRAHPSFRKTSIGPITAEFPDGIPQVTTSDGKNNWKYGYQKNWHSKNDYFEYTFDAAKNQLWVEFETQPLVKGGEYYIWVCGKCQSNRGAFDVYFDDVFMDNVDMSILFTPQGADEEDDWNNPNIEKKMKYYTTNLASKSVGFCVGKTEITTDGTHKVKFVATNEIVVTIDMIHFIPIDENQFSTKFKRGL